MTHARISVAGALLAPRSIAFVGVSAKGTGSGAKMLRSAIRSGFSGPIWPVHRDAGTLEGLACVPSLANLPQAPDCVVVAVPAPAAVEAVRAAAARGAKAALVVSEGFADTGTEEGRRRQEELVAVASAAGLALAGPNCMGVASLVRRFAATMADIPTRLPAGGFSLVSQSGGLLNAVAEFAGNRGIGMNYLLSIGNQAALDLADYIDFLAEDPDTRVIGAIMEGAKDGRRFADAIANAASRKPVVVLKLGRSELGQAATLAHTGTLAGRNEAYEALFQRHGVASVFSLDELVETATLFDTAPLPDGNGVCLLTVSGGATSLISDLGERAGVRFPALSDETNARVEEALAIRRQFSNPLDTVGMPRLRREGALDAIVDALLLDPAIDVIGLVLGMRMEGAENHDRLVEILARRARGASKPILVLSFISGSLTDHWRGFALRHGLALLEDLERGLRAVRHLCDYVDARKSGSPPDHARGVRHRAPAVSAGAALSETASKVVLARRGLPITREYLSRTCEDVPELAARIGGVVALKVQSPDIPHKSDIGGVFLSVTATNARAAAATILENARKACPAARIEGVLVQEMVEQGAEFILGMTYDPQFGPLIVLGGGGVMVEIFKDAVVRLAPVSPREAERMIDVLRSAIQLDGFRGAPRLDRKALVDCIVSFSDFVVATDGQYAAIDLNPVIVRPDGGGVRIADALIITNGNVEETKNEYSQDREAAL